MCRRVFLQSKKAVVFEFEIPILLSPFMIADCRIICFHLRTFRAIQLPSSLGLKDLFHLGFTIPKVAFISV